MQAKRVLFVLLIVVFSASGKKPRVQDTSTVILRIDVGHTFSTVMNAETSKLLKVVNMDTNAVGKWYVYNWGTSVGNQNRHTYTYWATADVPPGRYLVTHYLEMIVEGATSLASLGEPWHTAGQEVRYELTVPKANVAIFYGTIVLPDCCWKTRLGTIVGPKATGTASQIVPANIDDTVQDYYQHQKAKFLTRRSELIAGEIKQEELPK